MAKIVQKKTVTQPLADHIFHKVANLTSKKIKYKKNHTNS